MENQITPTPEITPQPPFVPPATNPPKKSHLPLILTVIIIFAISVFGGVALGKFLYGPQSITPQPTIAPKPTMIPTVTPDIATSWKTYTNTKYGFSLKYPSNYKINNGVAEIKTATDNSALLIKLPSSRAGRIFRKSVTAYCYV